MIGTLIDPVTAMLDFQIPNMTCGHCVRAVTEAVKAADAQAKVTVDLPAHKVQVETSAPREAVVRQLAEAGYQPA
jgi:copper chaperone